MSCNIRGNAYNLQQTGSIPAIFKAAIERQQREVVSEEDWERMGRGGEAWQSFITNKCQEAVQAKDYMQATSGALGPDHGPFWECLEAESTRILRNYVMHGGRVEDIMAVRAAEDVPEGGTYTKITFRYVLHGYGWGRAVRQVTVGWVLVEWGCRGR